MNKALKDLLAVVLGVGIIAFAVCAWHFWQMDGFISFIIGACGLGIAGAALGYEM